MSCKVTVMYPNNPDTVFNMKHYLSHHMPLAEKLWGPSGMLKWQLVEVVAEDGREKSPFSVVNVLTWKDRESYLAASKTDEAVEILEDLAIVCNYDPLFVIGNVVARG